MSSGTNFAERYGAMSETELMDLARNYDDLVEVAQTALRAEFARRGLEPPLIEEEEEPLAGDEAEPVTVGQYATLPEALLSRAVLEQAGIRCFLCDENTVHQSWGLSNVAGVRLQVAAKDEAAAREVLTQTPEQIAGESDEDFIQPVCPRCGSTDIVANDSDGRASREEWRCMICDCVWADDESMEEEDGALR